MIENFADLAANERTFLAWVRTAVAIMGFGFVAESFTPSPRPVWSELAMIAAGGIIAAVAYLRMRHNRRRILSGKRFVDDTLGADGLLIALVAALFVLLAAFAIHAG